MARQNGKSTLSWVIDLWFLYVRGVGLVLGTAQDLDVAEEIWSMAVDAATDEENNPDLADEVAKVIDTNGKKALVLVSGSRYKVKATSRRAGRGLTGDLIMLDELREHQSWNAWSAVTKTTLTRTAAMVLGLSNAGDATSIVLRHLRRIGHLALGDPDGTFSEGPDAPAPTDADGEQVPETEQDDVGLFEWSARPGCDRWDRDEWAQANPSMNHLLADGTNALPEENIASAARVDPEWEFRVEVLCQWSDSAADGPFPAGAWEAGIDPASTIPEAAPPMSYVGVAGLRADDVPHVEVAASRGGTEWVVPWFKAAATPQTPITVVVQAKGAPAASLVEDLQALDNVEVLEWGGTDLGIACGQFFDRVSRTGKWATAVEEAGTDPAALAEAHELAILGLRHLPQPLADIAAALAATKPLGDTWAWDRQKSPVDIAPLVALTEALWGLVNVEPEQRSAYEDDDLMIV